MSPAILAFRRAELEARIEEMIALLDLIDGDSDFEPTLAFDESCGRGFVGGIDDDREDDEERELDMAEMGIADLDAMSDPELFWNHDGFDGSGKKIAERLLHGPARHIGSRERTQRSGVR